MANRPETRRLQLRGQPRHCAHQVAHAPRSLLIPHGNHRCNVALTEKKGQANPIARPRRLIIHPDKVQAVRWRDLAARGAIARGKRRGKIIRAPFAFADMNERADHGAYLVL